jgi:hypothetical protein
MPMARYGVKNMRDHNAGKATLGEPDFNLLLIANPYEPWRFRIEGTLRVGHQGDPYEELESKLKRLLMIRGATMIDEEAEL